jgi:1,4-alpha-glucan branching enzyme
MADETRTMPKHSGMGAIPNTKGVTFRVWAPHAEIVYLIGTFNGWSETSTPLFNEKNGYWSSDVPEAKPGDEYRYVLHAPADWNLPPLSPIDPYARKVTNAAGNGIVYDPDAFDWGDNTFQMATTDVKTRAEGTDGLPCSGEIGIGPYTVVIFSQDE